MGVAKRHPFSFINDSTAPIFLWGGLIGSSHLQAMGLLLFFDFLAEFPVNEVTVLLLFLLDPVLEHPGQACHEAEASHGDGRPAVVIQDPLGIFVALVGGTLEQIFAHFNVTLDSLTEQQHLPKLVLGIRIIQLHRFFQPVDCLFLVHGYELIGKV